MRNTDWEIHLNQIINTKYFNDLLEKINNEYLTKTIYPKKDDLFNAFKITSFKNIKMVVIGQDPYHTEGVADGLAFSTKQSKLPPSLKNIYKELYNDLGIKNDVGNLTNWAKEGILLLNTHLSVIKNQPGSHAHLNWEKFTDYVIKYINDNKNNIVFVLWGNHAILKEELINKEKHFIIKSSHPSPFSAYISFYGSKPFSKCNDYLKRNNIDPIDFKV